MFNFRKSTQSKQSKQTRQTVSASTTMLKVSPNASITKRVESFKEFISKQNCTSLSYRAFIREFGKTDKAGFLSASKLDINKAIAIACRELAKEAIENGAPCFFSADFNGDYTVINKRNISDVFKHFPELQENKAETKAKKSNNELLLDYISINSNGLTLDGIAQAIEALEALRKLKSKATIRKQATAKKTATVNFISSKQQEQASATAEATATATAETGTSKRKPSATAKKAKLVASPKTAKTVKA